MTWQENITIARVHLGSTETFKTTNEVSLATSNRFRDSAAFSHQILMTQYPDLQVELAETFPDVVIDDFSLFTQWMDSQSIKSGSPDITKIPQRHGAAHYIKKAQLSAQEYFIMSREPDNPDESKLQNIPGKRYTAPFFVLVHYNMQITEFDPDSHVVRKIYPLEATVQSVFLPTITAQKHAKWESPQLFPGVIGESMVFWDELSQQKLHALDANMRASKLVYQVVTSENVRVPIQAKGVSGKG